MTILGQQGVDDALVKLGQSVEKAEMRRDAQVALIENLAGQDRAQVEARHVLEQMERTLRQARQNHALVKSLSEPE